MPENSQELRIPYGGYLMIGRKNAGGFIALIMSAGLIASSLTAVFVAGIYNRRQFQMISSVSSAIIEEDPALEPSILSALKAYKNPKIPVCRTGI